MKKSILAMVLPTLFCSMTLADQVCEGMGGKDLVVPFQTTKAGIRLNNKLRIQYDADAAGVMITTDSGSNRTIHIDSRLARLWIRHENILAGKMADSFVDYLSDNMDIMKAMDMVMQTLSEAKAGLSEDDAKNADIAAALSCPHVLNKPLFELWSARANFEIHALRLGLSDMPGMQEKRSRLYQTEEKYPEAVAASLAIRPKLKARIDYINGLAEGAK